MLAPEEPVLITPKLLCRGGSLIYGVQNLIAPIHRKHKSLGPTEFLAPHGLAVDSHGDLYVGEVSWTNWPQTFRDKPRPDNLRSLHKFRKVG